MLVAREPRPAARNVPWLKASTLRTFRRASATCAELQGDPEGRAGLGPAADRQRDVHDIRSGSARAESSREGRLNVLGSRA